MPGNAIRSMYFDFRLQENNVAANLKRITGAGDGAKIAMEKIDVSGHKAQKRIAALTGAAAQNANAQRMMGVQTEQLSGFFGRLDNAEKRVMQRQTALGRVTNTLKTNYANLTKGIKTAGNELVKFGEKNRMALAATGAVSGLVAKGMLGDAISEEKHRLNVASLTAKGTGELQSYYDLIENRPDFTSKEDTAALISQLKLYQMTEDQITSLTPVIQHMVGVGKTNEEILASVGSALGGQFRSLKMMGITLMEADVTEYIKEHKKELEGLTAEQKKAAAFTALFIPKATAVIGDFEEVEKSAFIQQMKLSAAMSDLSGDAGATFIPAFVGMVKGVTVFVNALENVPYGPAIFGLTTIGVLAASTGLVALPFLVSGLTMVTGSAIYTTASTWLMAGGFTGLAAGIWAAAAPLLPFIAAAGILILVAQDLWVGLKGGDSVILNLFTRFKQLKYMIFPVLAPIMAVVWAFKHWREIPDIVRSAFAAIPAILGDLPAMFLNSGMGAMDAFVKGMTFGIMDTAKIAEVFGTIRDYLPFSDAKVGPLADLTLSGGRLVETFTGGMDDKKGLMGSAMGSILAMNPLGAALMPQGASSGGGVTVSVHFGDVHLAGDKKSMDQFGAVTVDAIEKAMATITRNQARSAGVI